MVSEAEDNNPFAPAQPASAAMDTNLLTSPHSSDDDVPPTAGVLHTALTAAAAAAPVVAPPSLAPGAFPSSGLQTIDFRHHVPITLGLHAGT